jgi:hypothetical protein
VQQSAVVRPYLGPSLGTSRQCNNLAAAPPDTAAPKASYSAFPRQHQTVPPHSPDGEYVPRSIEVKNAGDFSAVFFVLQGIGEYDFFRAPEGLTQDEIERIVM